MLFRLITRKSKNEHAQPVYVKLRILLYMYIYKVLELLEVEICQVILIVIDNSLKI